MALGWVSKHLGRIPKGLTASLSVDVDVVGVVGVVDLAGDAGLAGGSGVADVAGSSFWGAVAYSSGTYAGGGLFKTCISSSAAE